MANSSIIASDEGQVAKVVGRMMSRRGVSVSLTRHSDLKDSGLTSLDMVNLMLAVESACGILIPQSAMTPENFTSIATIEALVSALQTDAPQPLPHVAAHVE
jgi:acyl carrier protein